MIYRITLTLLAIPAVYIVANVLATLLIIGLIVACVTSIYSGERWP